MANPPGIIPPFNNVPAPGSPIRSDWPIQITNYAVQNSVPQFASAAARDAAIPDPDVGQMCAVGNRAMINVGPTSWYLVGQRYSTGYPTTAVASIGSSPSTIATATWTMPAYGIVTVNYSAQLNWVSGSGSAAVYMEGHGFSDMGRSDQYLATTAGFTGGVLAGSDTVAVSPGTANIYLKAVRVTGDIVCKSWSSAFTLRVTY